ncbi:ABC transporter permease [Deminuibacter soli]|uniref:ABC transporter permease n=1 Tax=Deminuibacter soli TaxID=2291815 RepID=A0A3E1NCZ4_9BACT|nr:ABC transporter permease [Deminuibacter soli]RFM25711.1 ABC transporter permease [Deminuibacter soli]
MFKNYFKTAWRNIVKYKSYSLLNILGLATGMAVGLLIGLWIYFQFSYDRFVPGYQSVYQAYYVVNRNGEIAGQTATSLLLADVMKSEIPEIAYTVQTDWGNDHSLMRGDKKIYQEGMAAGKDFFHVFPFNLLSGTAGSVLHDPYSIVLSRSTATALFGKENPVNQTVRLDNTHDMKVTGVMEDLPGNSSFSFHYLIPFSYNILNAEWIKIASTTWNNNSFQTFLSLKPATTFEQVQPKLKLINSHFPDNWKVVQPSVKLHPMKNWHLYSSFSNGSYSGGFIEYVRMFAIIGALVILIACINFTNLSIAQSEKRAREVGVRKAIGSGTGSLVYQFLMETLVITCCGLILALLLVQLALPAFNTLTGSTIQIPWQQPAFWACLAAFVVITTLLAGGRPAFYFSSFQPMKVLKGTFQAGKPAAFTRQVLVVLQFSSSVALIISTIIIYQQIQYVKDRPTGYNSERLVSTPDSRDLQRNFTALKQDMLASGAVSDVASSSSTITGLGSWVGVDNFEGMYPNEVVNLAAVDISDDYFKTVGMQLLEGRNFTPGLHIDTVDVIANEAAVKRMRFKSGINQQVIWNGKKPVRIIGVVKDALMASPFSAAEPTFFVYNPQESGNILYRLNDKMPTAEALAKLGKLFNKYNAAYPYNYTFTDESYARKFRTEVLIGKLSALFAALAIFISCIGLFGLAAYVAHKRTREMGIRKVLGASVSNIWLLLSKDFVLMVLLSCVIASPVSWYFLNNWLHKYSYRISIGPLVFVVAAALALLITVFTVSIQAVRAAVANPVKSLKSE